MKYKNLFKFILLSIFLILEIPLWADSGSQQNTSTSKSGDAVLYYRVLVYDFSLFYGDDPVIPAHPNS